MLPVITDFQLVCCGVATFAAAVGYGITRRSPYRIPFQLPSSPILPMLDQALLGKRKRSASSVSDITTSTSESTSEANTSMSESGECENVSDGAPSSPPAPTEEEDDYVVVESPRKKQRRSASPERTVDEISSADMKIDDVPMDPLTAPSPIQEIEQNSGAERLEEPIDIDTETPAVIQPSVNDGEDNTTAVVDSMPDIAAEPPIAPISPIHSIFGTPMLLQGKQEITNRSPSPVLQPQWNSKSDTASLSTFGAFALSQQPDTTVTASTWASTSSWATRSSSTTIPSAFSISSTSPSKHTDAFSAFASSQSPFGVKRARDSDDPKPSAPAWRDLGSPTKKPTFLNNSTIEKEPNSFAGATSSLAEPEEALTTQVHVPSTHNYITGEEDETVLQELRSIRLLIKRGRNEFTDCGRGHIKVLCSKNPDSERLVFRREQVLKLGMNVRLAPTVRCTYSTDDHVLRVILKEQDEVVIYALKAGKAGKKEFEEFASLVVESPHLKPA